MTMNFRVAQLSDLPSLNVISVESKKYWSYPPNWMKKWEADLKISEQDFQDQTIILIELEREIGGFCVMKEEENYYEILHLWLLPKFIGKGLGKALLKKTLAEVVKLDKEVRVEADPNAAQFYQSQGFETFVKVESYPKGRFLPIMKASPSQNRWL